MNGYELLVFLSSIENAEGAKIIETPSRNGVECVYRGFVKVFVPRDISSAELGVTFDAKPFAGGKIKNAFAEFVSSVLGPDSSGFVTSVGNSHIFTVFLSEETIETTLPSVLLGFIDHFLPAIQPYAKVDFNEILNGDEHGENEEGEGISLKEIKQLLASIGGVGNITEERLTDQIDISFVYQNRLQANLCLRSDLLDVVYLSFGEGYRVKAFAAGKVSKELKKWAFPIITSYDKSDLGITAEADNSCGYWICLTKEALPAVKELLDGFEKDFIPSVKEYLK